MREFVGEKTEKLSKFLTRVYPTLTYAAFRKALRKKDVKVNGVRTSEDCMITVGSLVQVYCDVRPTAAVLYEDELIFAVDKPKGVVAEELAESFCADGKKVVPVHRLDRNTRGVLLFAKNGVAEAALTDGFKRRSFEKYYRARVYGVPNPPHAVLTAYLVKDSARGCVAIYDRSVKGGAEIKTEYRLLADRGDGTSDLSVRLYTGRTHQIRAHLAHIGHFVIGDGKYGREEINRRYGVRSQELTAVRLVLHFGADSPLAQYDGKEFTV